MVLRQNQIKYLYIWVHPDYIVPGWNGFISDEDIIVGWGKSLKILEGENDCAVIQTGAVTSLLKRSLFNDNRKREQRTLFERVAELEDFANTKLGERYLLWPESRFVYGDRADHVALLKSRFNITHQMPKLFEEIFCYGLKPDACVDWQSGFALPLAHESLPVGIIPYNLLQKRT